MKTEIVNPLWEDGDTRERIKAVQTITFEDGATQSVPMMISKDSPDWEAALAVRSEEEMDKIWSDHLERRANRQERQRQERKDQEARYKQEQLFAAKLELFEIDAIKESKDRAMKSKIRKAKSVLEAQVYASVLVMKAELESE